MYFPFENQLERVNQKTLLYNFFFHSKIAAEKLHPFFLILPFLSFLPFVYECELYVEIWSLRPASLTQATF